MSMSQSPIWVGDLTRIKDFIIWLLNICSTDLIEKVKTGSSPPFRPHVPADAFTSSEVKNIMNMCWAEKPEDRPSVKTVMSKIKRLMK